MYTSNLTLSEYDAESISGIVGPLLRNNGYFFELILEDTTLYRYDHIRSVFDMEINVLYEISNSNDFIIRPEENRWVILHHGVVNKQFGEDFINLLHKMDSIETVFRMLVL